MRFSLVLVIAVTLASQASAYVLRTDSTGAVVRWDAPVTFTVDPTVSSLAPEALSAVQSAVDQLGMAADVSLSVAQGATGGVGYSLNAKAKNTNAIVVLTEWPFSSSAIASTVVTVDAQSHTILDTDIALNGQTHHFAVLDPVTHRPVSSETGADDDTDALDDVQNTLTHELGHALGLQHNPDDAEAVMYPTAEPFETSKRSLTTDDQAGLVVLYPPGSHKTSSAQGCSSVPGPMLLGLLMLAMVLVRRPVKAKVYVRKSQTSSKYLGALLVLVAAGVAQAAKPSRAVVVDRVVEGTVTQVRTLEPKENQTLLMSEVTVQVSKCHAGANESCQSALVIKVPGGKWGSIEQTVTDQPVPGEGEPVAVALSLSSNTVAQVFHVSQPKQQRALSETLQQARLHPVSVISK